MSGILSTITGVLERLFGNLLPSWGDPMPPELPEPSELPEPEEGSEEGESDYETALAYQNTDTRWYSAIRRFLFWKKQDLYIKFYDRFTQWIGSENDFCDLSRDWFIIKANLNETLQEAHICYNDEANAIFWRSDGQIDLRKTGTYTMASLRFFQDVARYPRKAEDLSPEEDQWIRSAYIGDLTWTEPYEGIATELDFNEYYPHILAYGSTCWPIGPGEFKTFTHISVNPISFNLKYEIYHVFIGGQPAGQKCTRTFRYNPAGYYTHHNIQMAIDLGLHIELSSESPNALIFGPNQLMRGDEIFYQWA
ncbi:7530_t:CDS:1, partial [Dentiscutata erythropus]